MTTHARPDAAASVRLLRAKWGRCPGCRTGDPVPDCPRCGGGDGRYHHPLPCHLLDVAAVADRFWRRVLTAPLKQWLADALGTDVAGAGVWITFWAGLHDWGKATPPFQHKCKAALRDLKAAGWKVPRLPERHGLPPHGTMTAVLMWNLLDDDTIAPPLPPKLLQGVAKLVGGHHGTFPCVAAMKLGESKDARGDGWVVLQRRLAADLATTLGVRTAAVPMAGKLPLAVSLYLAGLVSVVDWIGSDEQIFPFHPTFAGDHVAYWRRARRQADEALAVGGWTDWQAEGPARSLGESFPFAPRRMQSVAADLAECAATPSLLTVEAPTGNGKTEAAFYAAERAIHDRGAAGLYVALPTQATSNQMFGRVKRFLAGRYDDRTINLHLLHGRSILSPEYGKLRRIEPDHVDAGSAGGTVAARSWFLPKKRTLLAPFGVGTVDQALLAVLPVKHGFVRLFGLAGRVVVLDEVHAYDAYTSTILDRLVAWLLALRCTVVILSATLPAGRRRDLLAVAGGTAGDAAYPCLHLVDPGGSRGVGFTPETEPVRLHLARTTDADLPALLAEKLADGGCAAVIVNTVDKAQTLCAILRQSLAAEVTLLHARFPFQDRNEREGVVFETFGPDSTRDQRDRKVLVATQVVEQSLDLDFDLMVTDYAPLDLVLQRAGRLHRHDRDRRPAGVSDPTLYLLEPEHEGGIPDFGNSERRPGNGADRKRRGGVYDRSVLLRTWLTLHGRDLLELPTDTAALIESVYGDPPAAPDDAWAAALRESDEDRRGELAKHTAKAESLCLPMPGVTKTPDQAIRKQLDDEDDPATHEHFRPATRLGDPAVEVVFAYGSETAARLRPGDRRTHDLSRTPDGPLARDLLRRSGSITKYGLVRELIGRNPPPGWDKSALLRHHRLLLLDDGHHVSVGDWGITLDEDLGIVISKNPSEDA